MKHSIKFLLAIALLGNLPVPIAHAAASPIEPSTRPAVPSEDLNDADSVPNSIAPSPTPEDSSTNTPQDKNRQRRPDRDRPRPALRFLQPYSQKETDDAMQFMQNHSPERFKFVSSLPESEKKSGIKNYATRAYQSWMRLSHDDWKLYAVVMKRVGVEDDIFGLVNQLHTAQAHNEPADKQQAITAQLHDKVASLVEIGLKERQIRLDNLSRTIKDEQQKLDTDSADTKSLVEKRMQIIVADDKLRAFRSGDAEESH